jgi:hypothetical protein
MKIYKQIMLSVQHPRKPKLHYASPGWSSCFQCIVDRFQLQGIRIMSRFVQGMRSLTWPICGSQYPGFPWHLNHLHWQCPWHDYPFLGVPYHVFYVYFHLLIGRNILSYFKNSITINCTSCLRKEVWSSRNMAIFSMLATPSLPAHSKPFVYGQITFWTFSCVCLSTKNNCFIQNQRINQLHNVIRVHWTTFWMLFYIKAEKMYWH